MSGHNPHSRVGHAVNSSQWNHLQVPPFISRQPQHAHMSNERPIRSPLAWHHSAPSSAEALYGYMAAAAAAASSNHKSTTLDINPLLPFVRSSSNTVPFGSVDLSISSTNHNNTTPSSRNQSTSSTNSTNHTIPTTNHHQNSQNHSEDQSIAFFNEMTEHLAALKANPAFTSNFFNRDHHLNSLNADTMQPIDNERPIDMMKESNCTDGESNGTFQHLLGLNAPHIPQNMSDLQKSIISLINNTQINGSKSNMQMTSKMSTSSASNDDSLDSQLGTLNGDDSNTKRNRSRRRKPQKTSRVSNESPTTAQNGNNSSPRPHTNTSSDSPRSPQIHTMDLSNHNIAHVLSADDNRLLISKPLNGLGMPPINSGFEHSNFSTAMPPLKPSFYTADLVKKVEELVKCNADLSNCNGFGTSTALPIKHVDEKLFEQTQCSNGDSKVLNVSEPTNCIDNGIIHGIKSPTIINENECQTKKDENRNGEFAKLVEPKLTQMTPLANSIDEQNNSDSNEMKDANKITGNSSIAKEHENKNDNEQSKPKDDIEEEKKDGNNLNDINKTNVNESKIVPSSSTTPRTNKKRQAAKRKITSTKRNNKSNGKSGKNGKTNNKKSNEKQQSDKNDKKKTKDESIINENATKFRGPYIQINPDGSETVINAPITEDLSEKQNKNRKSIGTRTNDRNKVRGLYVSTLSNRYDAITTDATWMCVFCKMGPHKHGLGDLFGPFIITTDSDEFQESQIDPNDDVFRSQRTRESLGLSHGSITTPNNSTNISSKKKRKLNDSTIGESSPKPLPIQPINIFYGMTKVNDTAYEIWTHEDCIVWSNGVHIIGARIVGLESAVWSSTRHQCTICKQYGAVISCLQRECTNKTHTPCAKQLEWSLNEFSFQTKCQLHAIEENHENSSENDDNKNG